MLYVAALLEDLIVDEEGFHFCPPSHLPTIDHLYIILQLINLDQPSDL